MLTAKQRANLRSLANNLDPVLQVGKDGITEGTKLQAEALFEAREMYKINVLKNCDLSPKEVANEFETIFGCDVVQVIGYKITVYRRSKKKNIKHIELL